MLFNMIFPILSFPLYSFLRTFATEKMVTTDNIYWYGVAAAVYLTSCWMFAAVRWFHTCQEPKERHAYVWPDRKLLVIIYLMATVLVPYVVNPQSPQAWTLFKSYFPGTYYFYGGALFFCFFGTVKQWRLWKTANWVGTVFTLVAMLPLVLDAWIPGGMLTASGARLWRIVVVTVSIGMMGYCGVAMRQTLRWMLETREENYSNPEDFPMEFARRVWLLPLVMTLLVWPPYVFDSPRLMAVMNVLLAVFNVVMLLFVLPAWRRQAFVPESAEAATEENEPRDEQTEARTQKIAEEIEAFVRNERGFLDPHLRIEHVVEHCSYSRTYVSQVFSERFGGFSRYVNSLRLEFYDSYVAQHPNTTKDAAAQESGFTSYSAYYKAKERYEG